MIWRVLRLAFDAAALAGRASGRLSKVPVVGPAKDRLADAVLDTIFGRPEDIAYVSRTAPRSPPPTR